MHLEGFEPPGLVVRSHALYPSELQVQVVPGAGGQTSNSADPALPMGPGKGRGQWADTHYEATLSGVSRSPIRLDVGVEVQNWQHVVFPLNG